MQHNKDKLLVRLKFTSCKEYKCVNLQKEKKEIAWLYFMA